jgi:lysophospholipase L1-like esterase
MDSHAGARLDRRGATADAAGQSMLLLRIQPANRDRLVDRSFLDTERATVRFRTDERSYILPSFRYEEPDATILFLGGSTTECTVVREELRFPALVSTLLAEEGLEVNTLNAGRSGNTANDSVNVLYNHGILDRPDIAVMMHATNDYGLLSTHGDYRKRGAEPLTGAQIRGWLKQELSRHVYLFSLVRQAAARLDVEHPGPGEIWFRNRKLDFIPTDEFRARLLAFIEMCRVFEIQPVLMTQPLASMTNELTPAWATVGGQDRFNQVVREVGQEQRVQVIDLARYLADEVPGWDEPNEIFFDGMHVTDRGSRVYAEHIAEQLLPLVRIVRR